MNKKTFETVIEFPYSDYYTSKKHILQKMLKYSRRQDTLQSPVNLLALQISLHNYISVFEKAIERQTSELGMAKSDPHVIYNTRVREGFKSIADGLAWRLLGFNRGLMRVFSQNRSPGHLKELTKREKYVLVNQMLEYGYVLINDITNILRLGDITVIDAQGVPEIIEVKKKGKKVFNTKKYMDQMEKGGLLSSQAQKIIEFNKSVRQGFINVGGSKTMLTNMDFPINTYHNTLKKVVSNCQESGLYDSCVDDLLYIRAIKPNKKNDYELPFKLSDEWLAFSNLETFCIEHNEVFRNIIPYSAYPMDDSSVLQLLSGEIILESFLNINSLVEKLKSNGWSCKLLKPKLIDEQETMKSIYSGSELFSLRIDNPIIIMHKGGFNLNVQPEHLCFVLCDFMKPDIINKIGDSLKMETEKNRESLMSLAWYKDELKVWI